MSNRDYRTRHRLREQAARHEADLQADHRGSLERWVDRATQGKPRFGSFRDALRGMSRFGGHDGKVRGYSRAHVEYDASVTSKRQATYIVRRLEAEQLISTTAEYTARGQQVANCYRILAPWVLAMIEGESRAAERSAEQQPEAFEVQPEVAQPPEPSPPRGPPNTLNRESMAEYWRTVNATRF